MLQTTLSTLFRKNSPLKIRPSVVVKNFEWFLGFARRCNKKDMMVAAEGIAALLNSSRSLYEQLFRYQNIDCEWEANGLLFIFRTLSAFHHYSQIAELLHSQFGVSFKRYDVESLQELEPAIKPGAAIGGYLFKTDGHLRPDRLLIEWRQQIEKLGVEIFEGCNFIKFVQKAKHTVAVDTTQGKIAADAFVVATGAWTPLLNSVLGCRIPIIPGKGYSVTMPRPDVCPKYPLIFEEDRVAVSPFRSAYRIGSMMDFVGYDATLNRHRLNLLYQVASLYLREPWREPVQEEWWGWRPMIYDGKPIIDRIPKMPNVFVAAGHGMLGLSMAPATGKLITEFLSGMTPHVDPEHYSINRFS
jgi:D-amino-acid dehydrogenase